MKIGSTVILTVLLAAVFATSQASEEIRAGSMAEHSVLPQAERSSSAAKPTRPPSLVTVEGGRLTLTVENRPIGWIIEEISRQSGIAVAGIETVTGETVSARLKDVPLDQGLREILKDKDLIFLYEAKERGGGVREEAKSVAPLKAVWVYPKGQGRRVAPLLSEQESAPIEIEENGSDHPGASDRARTIERLVKRKGEQALDDLLQALQDRDGQVRERALTAALDYGMPMPPSLLDDLVRYDPSPMVRFLTLKAIVNGAESALNNDPHIRKVAELALSDASPEVKEQAREILNRLDESLRAEPELSRGEQEVQ
jgi:hypothetical protein